MRTHFRVISLPGNITQMDKTMLTEVNARCFRWWLFFLRTVCRCFRLWSPKAVGVSGLEEGKLYAISLTHFLQHQDIES